MILLVPLVCLNHVIRRNRVIFNFGFFFVLLFRGAGGYILTSSCRLLIMAIPFALSLVLAIAKLQGSFTSKHCP